VQPSFGVLSIATDPDVRGAGVGRALMDEAETPRASTGHARMLLTVHPDNARAIRFYEQLG
jgi:ribosomal protein S18 acetylase RimI-like enzyme